MKETLFKFDCVNVLVVGDIMLDRYWYGSTSGISPEAPVPVVKVDHIEERPGGAANVAMNIATLGASSCLVGLTGVDDAAHALSMSLKNVNVKCDFVALPTHSTIIKLRIMSHNQQLIRLDFEREFENVDYEALYQRVVAALPHAGVLVLSDYAKGTLSRVQQMIQLARAANIPVLVDPKGTDFNRYRGATLLTPNLSEFEAIAGKCNNETQLIERGIQLIADYELSALLLTRSENGMTLLQPGKAPLHLLTQTQEVYDVTGAGDTVISVLATSLAAGNKLETACFLANAAAGVVVGKLGTSTISLAEIKNAIRAHPDSDFGIMSETQLRKAVELAHRRGEKVVMTNGVFDILHAGHVAYLSNARKLGDRLIVAVNSDASTKQLKGNSRPVNSLENRMTVLDSLKSVDWVVAFNEKTPQRLIANILPDLLVKGGNYKTEHIVGSDEVLANGGEVHVLNFKDGISTTNIIKRIRKLNRKRL